MTDDTDQDKDKDQIQYDQEARAELQAVTVGTLADMPLRTVISVALWGAAVGALGVVLSLLLNGVVIEPLFCQQLDVEVACAQSGSISFNSATVAMAIMGLVGLIKLSVFRPLLVAIAAAASLWGAHMWLGGAHWLEALLWMTGLYAVAYSLFAQVVRIQQFVVALLILVVLVVGVRVALVI